MPLLLVVGRGAGQLEVALFPTDADVDVELVEGFDEVRADGDELGLLARRVLKVRPRENRHAAWCPALFGGVRGAELEATEPRCEDGDLFAAATDV